MNKFILVLVSVALLGSLSIGCVSKTQNLMKRKSFKSSLNRIRLHFVDIGVGSCQLVECPGKDAPVMLVDCGSTKEPTGLTQDEAIEDVKRYVGRVIGQRKVIVVISHPDKDHYHHIPSVLKNKRIQSIWLGLEERDYPQLYRFFDDLDRSVTIYDQRDLGRDFHKENPVTKKPLMCGKARWYILAVNEGTSRRRRRPKKNLASLVVMIQYKKFSAIFPGDAYGKTEKAALYNAKDAGLRLRGLTVLSASHHGSHTHKSNRWFRKINPKIVVYTSGDAYGHPSCRVVKGARRDLFSSQKHTIRCAWGSREQYESSQSSLAEYVTETNGTVVISSDGRGKPTISCTTHPKLKQDKSMSCALR